MIVLTAFLVMNMDVIIKVLLSVFTFTFTFTFTSTSTSTFTSTFTFTLKFYFETIEFSGINKTRCDESEHFWCSKEKHCLPSHVRCNFKLECLDGTDELDCGKLINV